MSVCGMVPLRSGSNTENNRIVRLASALVQAGREEQARPILDEIVQRWPDSREAEAARKMMPITALAKP